MALTPTTEPMRTSTTQSLGTIWTVPYDDRVVKAVTIEQGPRQENPMCVGCPSKCCQGGLHPVLTKDEFLARKYRFKYQDAPELVKEAFPPEKREGLQIVVLAQRPDGNCVYFDADRHCCGVWPDAPKACQSYDCREEDRPAFKAMCFQRTQEWMAAKEATR
jgi:Fe-S-cluster containining protein